MAYHVQYADFDTVLHGPQAGAEVCRALECSHCMKLMKTLVDGAIHDAAGPELDEACTLYS
jgi:hypothetical protein